ncbi:MAG: 4-oxalocrotonate tautomerase family protein [Proteobacteria bacterium]|nr:4-oxalocrotonate tautomerase family protein [Pseudomonadota bacterium]
MPYVNIRVTRGVTLEQKEKLIAGVTDLLVKVLNKNPERTFVVIDEVEPDNWGVAGVTTTVYRQRQKDSSQRGP